MRQNYKALVTGAAGGIGGAIVEKLVSEGAQVVGIDKRFTGGKDESPCCLTIKCDVTDEKALRAACADTLAYFGGELDIVVNSAGEVDDTCICDDVDCAAFDYYMHLILRTPMLITGLMKDALKRSKNPSIHNISAYSNQSPRSESIIFNLANSALVSYTRQAAYGLGPIRSNCLSVGGIETSLYGRGGLNWDEDKVRAYFDAAAAASPIGITGAPEDVAEAVVFLASSDAMYITGANILIDGGLSVVQP